MRLLQRTVVQNFTSSCDFLLSYRVYVAPTRLPPVCLLVMVLSVRLLGVHVCIIELGLCFFEMIMMALWR